jgi:hypothetical protein
LTVPVHAAPEPQPPRSQPVEAQQPTETPREVHCVPALPGSVVVVVAEVPEVVVVAEVPEVVVVAAPGQKSPTHISSPIDAQKNV